jgi:hypothetical protein
VWLLVSASRRAHLEPTSASAGSDGWLRLRGELLSPVEQMLAQNPHAERERFYERLALEREAGSLTSLDHDPGIEDLAERHVARVARGAATPDDALADLLQEARRVSGAGVTGWYLEGSGEEEVPLPDELVAATADRIGAAVGAYQPSDSPWGRSLVLVVLVERSTMRSVRVLPGLVANQPSMESHRRSR